MKYIYVNIKYIYKYISQNRGPGPYLKRYKRFRAPERNSPVRKGANQKDSQESSSDREPSSSPTVINLAALIEKNTALKHAVTTLFAACECFSTLSFSFLNNLSDYR